MSGSMFLRCCGFPRCELREEAELSRRCGGVTVVFGSLSAPLFCALSCRCLFIVAQSPTPTCASLSQPTHNTTPHNTTGHRTLLLLYDHVVSAKKKSHVVGFHVGPRAHTGLDWVHGAVRTRFLK